MPQPPVKTATIKVWVGLDVGKTYHHATAINGAGEVLFARQIPNTQSDLEKLVEESNRCGQAAVVIDQPGSIAQITRAVADRAGIGVAYIPGLVMRRAADLYPGQAKTDARDSYVLADTARTRPERLTWIEPVEDLLVALQMACGRDEDLAHDFNRAANRLRDLLSGICPPLEALLGPRLAHPAIRALLRRYPTPKAMRAAGPKRLGRLITRHAPKAGKRLTTDLLDALASQTLTTSAEHHAEKIITELATDLDTITTRRTTLAADIEEIFTLHPLAPILISLPGIGPRLGARILTEIGDITRFPTAAHLAAYAGIAPVTRQSGTSLRSETRSRRGNHRLKNALFLAAFCSLNHPPSRAYYDRKREGGKRHNAAIICLARRRTDVLHAMLTTRTPYHATP